MPVTHGVAGSSPVQTAKRLPQKALNVGCFFWFISFFSTLNFADSVLQGWLFCVITNN